MKKTLIDYNKLTLKPNLKSKTLYKQPKKLLYSFKLYTFHCLQIFSSQVLMKSDCITER